jgi:nucleoside-diphosphate kinase
MPIEQTLSIIKPNGVSNNLIGTFIARFEKAGLKVVAIKMLKLDRERADAFYAEHRGKHFYEALTTFMSSGPVIVQVLEGENAISKHRELMGATDPQKAAPGSIRSDFSSITTGITDNIIHGSDAVDTAKREISFFFDAAEIFSR